MAYFPCDRGHPNPKGRNQSVYTACGSGSDMNRYRLRLCGLHAAEVYEHLAKFEVDPSETAIGLNAVDRLCLTCGKELGELGWQVFVTCYPANDERKDYWAQLHVDCRLPEYLVNLFDDGGPSGVERGPQLPNKPLSAMALNRGRRGLKSG